MRHAFLLDPYIAVSPPKLFGSELRREALVEIGNLKSVDTLDIRRKLRSTFGICETEDIKVTHVGDGLYRFSMVLETLIECDAKLNIHQALWAS